MRVIEAVSADAAVVGGGGGETTSLSIDAGGRGGARRIVEDAVVARIGDIEVSTTIGGTIFRKVQPRGGASGKAARLPIDGHGLWTQCTRDGEGGGIGRTHSSTAQGQHITSSSQIDVEIGEGRDSTTGGDRGSATQGRA